MGPTLSILTPNKHRHNKHQDMLATTYVLACLATTVSLLPQAALQYQPVNQTITYVTSPGL